MILLDPSAAVFETCEERTPTRVLAAAIFCTLEKHLFDETTPRAEVATDFCITAAQLHKSVTGVDYQSSPHAYKRKQKAMDTASTTTKIQKTATGPSSAPSTSDKTPHKMPRTQETSHESGADYPKTGVIPSDDTLSSASSDFLYDPFK